MKKLNSMLTIIVIALLIGCGSDDSPDPVPTPIDFEANFIGLWEFDTPSSFGDAIYFGENGEAFPVSYGDLGTNQFRLADFNSYTYSDNQVSYFWFGDEPVPFDGSNTLAYPGGSLTKVAGINALTDFVDVLDFNDGFDVDVSAFLGNDSENNLDGFGNELLIPNPSNAEGRYLRFLKGNLSFLEEVPGIDDNASSIGVYDTNPFELLSVLELGQFKIYQPGNPANPPAIEDISFLPINRYRCHAVTNADDYDFISYNRETEAFTYHDVDETHQQNGVEAFAFLSLPVNLRITGMDYIEGQNKLLVTDSFNLYIFNIGFNSDGDGVSIFELDRNVTTVTSRLGETYGRIQGVHYDASEDWLFVVINDGSTKKLVRMDFQL